MRLIGLTGGIGMGKSAAVELLRQRGVPVVDTDIIARQVVEPGQPALAEIKAAFGLNVFAEDGRLRRDVLAERVFANPADRRRLESILHPRIRAVWQAEAEAWRAAGRELGVVVIPLLFETGAEKHFHATVCLACSPATQRRRLRERGWTDAEIDRRIRAQWPLETKIARADFVIWTEGSLSLHAEQLDRILGALAGEAI
ncbi:MAG: dephospho-CoA kinase [Candidatus Omnitrophica bacterium]|nr:dephospho-CoA kinase [Candidatus Omnitrophota bacterium]